jgi:2,5-diamino-6-(ribosylamino)-4(3H)-pyrimidinone 5'-phosphate reductase
MKGIEMKPYIVCHMLSSIDGRINGDILADVIPDGEYETTGSKLKGDAWVCGRITMQQHFAEKKLFISKSGNPAGPQPVHVAQRASSYAISIDTLGRLRWTGSDIDGDHLICVVSERAPVDYLPMLSGKGISYIVAGKRTVDLAKAVSLLGKHFNIKRLLLEGGGEHPTGAASGLPVPTREAVGQLRLAGPAHRQITNADHPPRQAAGFEPAAPVGRVAERHTQPECRG